MTDDELIQRLSLFVLGVRELVAERDQLRADNERLRAGLEKIAPYVQVETVNPFYFVQVAREALGRDDGGYV